MAPFETVLYEKRGPVAFVTLNRPEAVNAYNMQMRDDLWEVFGAAGADPDVCALVLRGAGDRGFCAGADLSEFGSAPSQPVARAVRWERDVFGLLMRLDKPAVASLHGHTVGSGVELALLCDLRVAAAGALFSMPETSRGLIAAAGGTQTLPRIVGRGRALDMLLAGRVLEAQAAQRAGLVHRVVERNALDSECEDLAGRLANLDSAVAGGLKRALRAARDGPLASGLAVEARIAQALFQGAVR